MDHRDVNHVRPPRGYNPACSRCHARKVKCDALPGKTCTNCRSARMECTIHEKRRRNGRFSQSQPLAVLLPIPSDLVGCATNDRGLVPAQETFDHETPQPTLQRVQSFNAPADAHDEVDQAAAALSSLQKADDHGAKRCLVEMLSQEDVDHRVMQKGVRIVYVGQEYSNINYLIRHRARNEAVHHFAGNQISRQYTSHELDRIPKEAFVLPAAPVVDELLGQYFIHVNPGFPILDEEVFMSQYRGRDPQNPPSLLVLQAVLMVGAHVSEYLQDRDLLKASFFRRAKMLFDARFEGNRDVVVQAALLLTWHSEGVEDVGANSYHWVGVAVRTAHGLGMHRDCGPSTLIAHDKCLWRRLWWILLQFDVMVSLSYGRPQALNLDDSDVPLLDALDFKSLGENIDADFVLHHTELCRIISSVLRDRFGLRIAPARRKAALVKADQHLADWMVNLPNGMQTDLPETARSIWSVTLHISYNNMLILLHRPPPKPATLASAVRSDDIEICSAAAGTMVSLFETIWRQGGLRYLNVFSVNALFTTMIQLSAETRVANPVLAANAMRRFDTALDILRHLAEYWLNAEIILRLFEESSDRLQQDLRIGKAVTSSRPSTSCEQTSTPYSNSVPNNLNQESLAGAPWNGVTSQPAFNLTAINELNEQFDWSNLYWENSGFPPLSPFGDLDIYPTAG